MKTTQKVRISNPGTPTSRMSEKQKAYFAKSPQTRASARKKLGMGPEGKGGGTANRGKKLKRGWAAASNKGQHKTRRNMGRAANVGSIVKVDKAGKITAMNRGDLQRAVQAGNYRTRNAGRVTVLTPTRGASRISNPRFKFFDSAVGDVTGVLSGSAATKLVVDNVLPMGLRNGWPGYLSAAVISALWGLGAGFFSKSQRFGRMVAAGGGSYVALRILQDMVPPLATTLSPYTGAMGEIVPSSFWVPDVSKPGSMTEFYPPRELRNYVAKEMARHGRRAPHYGEEKIRATVMEVLPPPNGTGNSAGAPNGHAIGYENSAASGAMGMAPMSRRGRWA